MGAALSGADIRRRMRRTGVLSKVTRDKLFPNTGQRGTDLRLARRRKPAFTIFNAIPTGLSSFAATPHQPIDAIANG
jgi:hypothetical protein